MCGIAGIIGKPDRVVVEDMLACMRHRGPDDNGIFDDDFLTIGMNRLSIQDTSISGRQPMASDDERYYIVFNGEVYNFNEIRSQLNKAGHSFHSTSDTEVVLKAYIEHGERCLQLFRGMFAFLIYDRKSRTVFAARDRFGIKPLYFVHHNDSFIFASELKGIFASRSVAFEIPLETTQSVLLFGTLLPGQSMIRGVQSLEPASCLTLNNGQVTVRRYWQLETIPEVSKQLYDYREATEMFRDKLKEAVDLSFISDRAIGVFLSAGIDSVSILASARLLGKENVKTFTVGFADGHDRSFDETTDAQSLASHFGYQNETVMVDGKDFQNSLNSFVDAIDFPSADGVNTFLVSRAARKHLVVALSGLGSDELLSGYARDRACVDWAKQKNPLPDALIQRLNYYGKRYNTLTSLRVLKKILNGSHTSDYLWNYFMLRQITTLHTLEPLLSEDISRKDWLNFYQIFDKYRMPGNAMKVNQVSQLELNTYMTNQLLRDMDAVSMHNSMEVRFPFLDHHLAEFIFSLPDDFKVRKARKFAKHKEGLYSYDEYGSKRILLDAFQEQLPPDYMQKKKRGFSLPLLHWLHQYCREEMEEMFNDSKSHPFFSARGLRLFRNRLQHGHEVTHLMWITFLILKWEVRAKETFYQVFSNQSQK